jgi:putative tryptophan/tyrosine transport system substrate-binding protein
MRRRNLLCQLPAWLAAPALAQTPASPKLLVVLTIFAKANLTATFESGTRQELARLGWRVGDNLRLEFRYGDNRPERLDELARELLALQPTAALVVDMPAIRALMRHSTRLPIVIGFAGDPVATGLAASLGRPGGQVTGMTPLFEDIRPKIVELARQVAPSARRLAGMFNRSIIPEGQFDAVMAGSRRMAQQVGLEYLPLPVRDAGEIEAALRSLAPVHEYVLTVHIDPLMFVNYASIAAQARTLRLPSGSQNHRYAQAGGLFAYGTDETAVWLRAIQKADEVLRGKPVGEIPFEQPTRIILTLNRDTAKSIGLTFPQELLLRADEVIG